MFLGVLQFRTNFLEFVYLYTLSTDLMRLQMHCRQPKPWCFLGQPQGLALKLISPLKKWKEKYKYRKVNKNNDDEKLLDLLLLNLFKLIETCFSILVTLNLETPMHSFCALNVFYPAKKCRYRFSITSFLQDQKWWKIVQHKQMVTTTYYWSNYFSFWQIFWKTWFVAVFHTLEASR